MHKTKNLVIAVALMSAAMIGFNVYAESMRPANGQPCYPTERTYYDSDGVTPKMCKASGGPVYKFKVYSKGILLWDGVLPSDKPEVVISQERSQSDQGKEIPQLVFRRDLERDPNGRVVFLGERKKVEIDQLNDGNGNSIALPTVSYVGESFFMHPNSDKEVYALSGKYRIAIHAE